MTTLQQHLQTLKEHSHNNRERGLLFEKLMQAFLLKDKEQQRFSNVWLWSEWAEQQQISKTDTGIDLVAQQRDGTLCAIQCKFYDEQHTLQKSDIDSFFTASGKAYNQQTFQNRLIISTTDKWSKHADEALQKQQIPCSRLGVQDLTQNSSIKDWGDLQNPQSTIQVDERKKTPRPHKGTPSMPCYKDCKVLMRASSSWLVAQAKP